MTTNQRTTRGGATTPPHPTDTNDLPGGIATTRRSTDDHGSSVAVSHPSFLTVAEAARLLRVDPATIYRAIRADAFPAIRVRSRYVIPAAAVEQMIDQATETGACVDVAAIATARRLAREVARAIAGQR